MLRRGCQVPRGERGASSDFRSARSCASHPSSKMEPALALLHPSTFGDKISEHPSGSGEQSRVLDPPQPAHAKPRICNMPAWVQ